MTKKEKIELIEKAKGLFFAIENVENEEDPYANEYELYLITDEGIRIENGTRHSGVGMDRMFAYLYYYLNPNSDWANEQFRKAYLVNR